jgi:ABC-2 type transport system ATP-binding protein
MSSEASEPAVRVRGLVKRYGELVAVDGVDLEVRRGGCVALLGPNGAGKTTTIEILEGLKRADAGEVEVLGRNWQRAARAIRSRIGVQLQETNLQDKLSTRETLRLFACFYESCADADVLLEEVGLADKRDGRVGELSGGQKQRLSIGCALLNRPEVLFLDEPTTGLDPQARRRVWEIVERFKRAGGSVLLTTHFMDEAERLADDLVILDRGRVIARGSPTAVVATLGAESVVELVPVGSNETECDDGLDAAGLGQLPGVRAVRRDGSALVLSVARTQESLTAILRHCERHGVALEALHTHRPTLEDVFVALTGKHLRDG